MRERVKQFSALLMGATDRRFWLLTAVCVLLTLTGALIGALTPLSLKYLVDGFHDTHLPLSPFLLTALWVTGLWMSRVLVAIRTYFITVAEQAASKSLSQHAFDHVLRLPIRFHVERHTGAIGETMNRGLAGFQVIYQQLFASFAPLAFDLVAMCLVLGHLNQPVYVAYFLGSLVLYAVAYSVSTAQQVQVNRDFNAAVIESNATLTDGVMNGEAIKYFGAERVFSQRYERALGRRLNSWMAFIRSHTLNELITATVFGAFVAATTLYAARQVQSGHMSVGEFVLVQSYALQLVRPIEGVGLAIQSVFNAFTGLERLLAMLAHVPETLSPGFKPFRSKACELEFRNISFSYQADRPTLREVSFRVSSGKTLGIVGTSGSGKSSLVRLLARFYEPECGVILLDGVPISTIPLAELRSSIAIVPQDTVLFDDTIEFNVGLGVPDSTRAEIEQATRLAQLHEMVARLPQGFETPVGERGARLSGGERQRVALARAAMRRPCIFVFDEATSSLDSRTEKEILNNLRTLARRSTTLIIAHRLSTVVHADEIVVLEHGVVIERGTHAELLAKQGKYQELWFAQNTQVTAASA